MGLFGGDSSSSQTVENEEITAAAQDHGIVVSRGGTGGVSVSVLDAGAVVGSLDLADATLEGYKDFSEFGLEAAGNNLDLALQFAAESLGTVERTVSAGLELQQRAMAESISAVGRAAEESQALIGEAQSGGAQRLLYFGVAAVVALVILAKVVK